MHPVRAGLCLIGLFLPLAVWSAPSLSKGRPWTEEEVLAALDREEDPDAIAEAIAVDEAEIYDVTLNRVGRRGIAIDHPLMQELMMHARSGAGPWAQKLVEEAVARERQRTKPLPVPVDTPALRTRANAGEPAAMLELYYALIQARRDDPGFADLREKLARSGYAPAAYLEGEKHTDTIPDKSQVDEALAAELFRRSAEAGNPNGAYELGVAFHYGKGVASNLLEAEYWFLQAAARSWPDYFIGNMAGGYLYKMYSFSHISADQAANARWAKELLRRGGQVGANTKETIEGESAYDEVRKKSRTLPDEIAPWSAAELAKLETAAKAGDTASLLKLGDAYASGRGVRQHDTRAVGYYRQAAAKGSAPAARALATMAKNGFGLKADQTQRLAWLQKAGEAGSATAWRELGDLYRWGDNDSRSKVAAKPELAFAAYEKAVALGDATALARIASQYKFGQGVAKDEAKARALSQQAAEKGDASSMTDVGRQLLVAKNYPDAIAWLQKAVAAGDVQARISLAEAYRRNNDFKPALVLIRLLLEERPTSSELRFTLGELLEADQDGEGALAAFRAVASDRSERNFHREWAETKVKALEDELHPKPGSIPLLTKQATAGDVNAMLQLAEKLIPTDKTKSLDWLKKAADTGNGVALRALALQTFPTDKAAGLALLQKAVAAGDLEAKFRLAGVLIQGQDLPADPARGVALLNEAADRGFAPAQFEVGRALMVGSPLIAANPTRGLDLLKKASNANYAAAAAVLGEIYERGAGVTADPVQALSYYEKAKRLGLTQVTAAIQRVQPLANAQAKQQKR